jgi:translocation and assembly module TamB
MARAIFLFLIAVAAIILIAAMTSLGPRLAKGPAEAALSRAIGRDVAIGAVEGRWHDLTFHRIAIRDDAGVFLTIDKARLAWSPASAFSRRYRVAALTIGDAALLRRPARSDEKRSFRGLELPQRLPDIVIGSVSLARLEVGESVAGRASVLSAHGSATIGGDRIDATLILDSEDKRDAVSLLAKTSGGRLTLDAEAKSADGGVIAALARTDTALHLSLTGDAPFDDFNARLSVRAGAYGDIDARFSADLENLEEIAFAGDFAPAARLASLKEITGAMIRFDAVARPHENGGAVKITSLEGAFGSLRGDIIWRNDVRALVGAEGAITLALDPQWRPAAQLYDGDAVDARFEIARVADRYRFALDAKSDRGGLSLTDATTDLRGALDGDIALTLKSAERISSYLSGALALSGRVSIDNGEARLSGMTVKDAGSSFVGEAALAMADKSISLDGEAIISTAATARAIAGLQPTAPLRARIKAQGPASDFSAQIEAEAPRTTYRGRLLPPLEIGLTAAGAASEFSGVATARAKGAPGLFQARYRRADNGALTLDNIDYRGKGFRLAGTLSAGTKSKTLCAKLDYVGERNAAPFPGVVLEGDAQFEARIAEGRADNALMFSASRIAGPGWAVANIAINARGPLNAMRGEAIASAAQIDRLPPMTGAKSTLIAGHDGAPTLVAEALSLTLAGMPARLAQPATIALQNGARIDDFDLRIGEEGVIRLDAAFGRQRWHGVAAAQNLPLGDGAATLDLDATFDTDKAQAAAGDFILRSADGDEMALAGRFRWDGAAITIADAGKGALDFEITAPARLSRRPTLRVGMKGPLLGRAAYEGPLEIIAPFLPSFAQSLNGTLGLNARLSGTTERPAINGDLSVRNGAYTDVVSDLVIVGIDASATAVGDAVGTRAEFSAKASGPGQKEKTIAVEGKWRLDTTDRLDAVIRLAGANLAAGPVTSARADGELKLAGNRKALTLSGELSASRLDAEFKTQARVGLVDVEVVALDRPSPIAAPLAERRAAPLAYDVRARASERAFVRGRGLISEWSADLSIAGDAAHPLILGAMNLVEGELEFSGRQFNLTEGVLQFDRLNPNDPLVRIVAEFDSGDVDARIRIEGRASAPRITLDSTPARPTEDVVALVLFGKPAAELSAFESLQAAQALANLGAVGPFGGGDVAGLARKAIGLDLLSVDLDADAGASSLTVGKYISDDVFISARQDARGENGAIRIEFDVTNDITLETEVKQDGEQTVSANWKKDF